MAQSMTCVRVCDRNFGSLYFGGHAQYVGSHFHLDSHRLGQELDYLILLDSRGISSGYDGSLAMLLKNYLKSKNCSFLIICRPVELTCWATLISTFKLNSMKPRKIITNMGFVDFTPKKKSVALDLLNQTRIFCDSHAYISAISQNSTDPSGPDLFSVNYTAEFHKTVTTLIHSVETIVIDTPLVDQNIKLERQRPLAFFDALVNTRNFLRSLTNCKLVELDYFSADLTYDGVHYTRSGNLLVFERTGAHL